MTIGEWIEIADQFVWGPGLLFLLLGTGIYLMLRLHFMPIRMLKKALLFAFSSGSYDGKKKEKERGKVSSFSALTTELATTIGTGNIIGVATAMVLGGPGALFWMVITSFLGMATKLVESTLAVKYRGQNRNGIVAGGPMYVLQTAFPNKKAGTVLAMLFSVFAVLASFGMGNMVQSNSIADALHVTFHISSFKSGLFFSIATILVILGGIGFIGTITKYLVPMMGVLYLAGTLVVLFYYWENIPSALVGITRAAFQPCAVSGGLFGHVTVSSFEALRWGVSRGVFSNEAGLGATGITAASADTKDPVRQGYISMTGVFFDTIVICTATGLALAASGVLSATDQNGQPFNGTALVLKAYHSVLGNLGEVFIGICIVLFAFATIVGWAYQGERAFEFLMGGREHFNLWYRFAYGLLVFVGCVCPLQIVWDISDICNGFMAIPNLVCILFLSGKICNEIRFATLNQFDGKDQKKT